MLNIITLEFLIAVAMLVVVNVIAFRVAISRLEKIKKEYSAQIDKITVKLEFEKTINVMLECENSILRNMKDTYK